MIDIQLIRDNPELVKEKSAQKLVNVDIDQLLGFDNKRRELVKQVEAARARRNELAHAAKGQRPSQEHLEDGRQIKQQLLDMEHQLTAIEQELLFLLKQVPNMPTDDTPVGSSEDDNMVIKEWGNKPEFDFEPKNHWEIGEAKGWLDKKRAAKVAGSRFTYIKGDLVLLEFALWQFALETLTNAEALGAIAAANNLDVTSKPFTPVLPPAMARTEVYEATARLDKEQQTYRLADDDLWLNASAEHTMAPMFMNETLVTADLPQRFVGYTTAFRREAGTYGKDSEGIIRLHQFNKMEMESFTDPEFSLNEHHFMVAIQEHLMQSLGLPHRVLLKCTADIGGPNARGVDIDVWLPGQHAYRETHTADYMTDYQARRLGTKIKKNDGSTVLAHTNDATVFSERPLVGILENFQTKEGNVRIPDVLQKYMGGRQEI